MTGEVVAPHHMLLLLLLLLFIFLLLFSCQMFNYVLIPVLPYFEFVDEFITVAKLNEF